MCASFLSSKSGRKSTILGLPSALLLECPGFSELWLLFTDLPDDLKDGFHVFPWLEPWLSSYWVVGMTAPRREVCSSARKRCSDGIAAARIDRFMTSLDTLVPEPTRSVLQFKLTVRESVAQCVVLEEILEGWRIHLQDGFDLLV